MLFCNLWKNLLEPPECSSRIRRLLAINQWLSWTGIVWWIRKNDFQKPFLQPRQFFENHQNELQPWESAKQISAKIQLFYLLLLHFSKRRNALWESLSPNLWADWQVHQEMRGEPPTCSLHWPRAAHLMNSASRAVPSRNFLVDMSLLWQGPPYHDMHIRHDTSVSRSSKCCAGFSHNCREAYEGYLDKVPLGFSLRPYRPGRPARGLFAPIESGWILPPHLSRVSFAIGFICQEICERLKQNNPPFSC